MEIQPQYDGPPIVRLHTGEGGDRGAVGALCVRQRRRLLATLAALGDGAWRVPTRCEGWDVQDVAAHLDGTNRFWDLSLTSGLAGDPTRFLVGFDPKATPAAMVDAVRDADPAATLAGLTESTEALCRTIEGVSGDQWDTLAEAPAGHLPISSVVHHALWDCWVHERDIALALGRAPVEEPDEVLACLRFVAGLGPSFALSVGKASTPAALVMETAAPDARVTVEVTDHVAVHDRPVGDATVVLRDDAVALVEALSVRAPLRHDVPAEHRWLVASLAEVFEVAGA